MEACKAIEGTAEKPRPVMVSDLPKACAAVLNGPAPNSVADVTYGVQ